jgi:hypothetical protein
MAGLAIALAAYAAFLLTRRLRARYAMSLSGGAAVLDGVPTSSAATSLFLEFPQSQPPLADIWGTNEELQMLMRLFDSSGISLAARPIEISVDGRRLGRAVTDGIGTAIFKYTFAVQGRYNIGCSFAGDEINGPCSESKMIRIVDFREEAVNLFNNVVRTTKVRGVRITGKLTPREVERIIISSFKDVDKSGLDRFIGYAEEALYSSHDFTRESYIAMFGSYKPVFVFIEEA